MSPPTSTTSGCSSRNATCRSRRSATHRSSLSKRATNALRASRMPKLQLAATPDGSRCTTRMRRSFDASKSMISAVEFGRAIVDHDDFDVAERLAADRVDRRAAEARLVSHRHDDADERQRGPPSWRLTLAHLILRSIEFLQAGKGLRDLRPPLPALLDRRSASVGNARRICRLRAMCRGRNGAREIRPYRGTGG